MSTAVDEAWSPEPELREPAPRRVTESPFPDLNRPNVVLFCSLGAVAVAVGIIFFVLGMSSRDKNVLPIAGGAVLALVGGLVLAIFPQKLRGHLSRAENLVMNGVPIIARVVSVTNMTGDSVNGRSVKYQVSMPGGDMVHRDVNADDRALPKRIPGNVTALVDMRSNDVEIYCALPYRAVSKAAPTPPPGARPGAAGSLGDLPTAQPSNGDGKMGTVGDGPAQQPQQTQNKSTHQGLPWE